MLNLKKGAIEKVNSAEKFVNFEAWITNLKEFIFKFIGKLKLSWIAKIIYTNKFHNKVSSHN